MLSPPRFAAIDVGTNALKLRVVARETERGTLRFRPLLDRVAITGLGRGLSSRTTLDPAARERSIEALRSFAEMLADYGCAATAMVGTQCLREARDADDFIAQVKRETGLTLEVISGREEARLSFIGASLELPGTQPDTQLVTFDVGGGSTELCWGRPGHMLGGASLAIGALSTTENVLTGDPPAAAAVAEASARIARDLAAFGKEPYGDLLVGIGGTPATLGAVQLGQPLADAASIHGHLLARAEVERQIALYQKSTVAERRRIKGLHSGRADVILAGALIVAAIMDRFACSSLVVSAHGLRQGLLRDRFRTTEVGD